MSRERTTTRSRTRSVEERPNTLVNVLVGAAATIVAAPLLPFAAIVGGGLAGYLQRSDPAEGAKVGAMAGAVASIPAFFLAWLVLGVFLLGSFSLFAITSVIAGVAFAILAGYLVGAGALGGAVGAFVQREL